MRLARDILSAFVFLIAGYLLLVHSGGFAADVRALGSSLSGTARTLQGR